MKTAIFMMGSPGSGKSYVASSKYPNTQVLDCDKFKESHPDYDPKNPGLLHTWSASMLEKAFQVVITKEEDFILDGTGANTDKMFRQMSQSKINGFEVTLVYVTVPLKVCLERNQKRARTVPEDVLISKYNDVKYGFELVSPHADEVKVVNNV